LWQNDTANGYIYINEICKKLYKEKLEDRLKEWGFGLQATHNFLCTTTRTTRITASVVTIEHHETKTAKREAQQLIRESDPPECHFLEAVLLPGVGFGKEGPSNTNSRGVSIRTLEISQEKLASPETALLTA